LEVACQSLISPKSDPQMWKLHTNSSMLKRKVWLSLCHSHKPIL